MPEKPPARRERAASLGAGRQYKKTCPGSNRAKNCYILNSMQNQIASQLIQPFSRHPVGLRHQRRNPMSTK